MTQTQVIQIKAQVPWNCMQGKGGNWIAACQPLKITLQAATWSELMEDISTSLDLLFKDLLETNELRSFLQDHGWVVVSGAMPTRPDTNVRFDVPFIPAIVGTNGLQTELHQ